MPEADLDSDAVEAQRRRIQMIGDQLWTDLSGTKGRRVRRFDGMPLIVLTIDEPARCQLASSELVASVQLDEPVPPSRTTG